MLPHVFERDGELIAHLISHHPADAYAAWFSQGFKARSDVDTIAEDVVLVDNDVADIDAYAEIDAPIRFHAGVARHLALHIDRAMNRIDHARKLAEQTVARRVDDATAMLLDLEVGNLSPQRLQRSERAFLVRPHQARVTCNVGHQNRCKAPLDRWTRSSAMAAAHTKSTRAIDCDAEFNTVFSGARALASEWRMWIVRYQSTGANRGPFARQQKLRFGRLYKGVRKILHCGPFYFGPRPLFRRRNGA